MTWSKVVWVTIALLCSSVVTTCGVLWWRPGLTPNKTIVASFLVAFQRNQTGPEWASPVQAVVAHSGNFWWGSRSWAVTDCTWQGYPLDCQYLSAGHATGNATAEALLSKAGALIHHMCWDAALVPEQLRHLPQVLFSMESDANYPCINNQHADMEMSYRQCAQVCGSLARLAGATVLLLFCNGHTFVTNCNTYSLS